MSTRIVPLLVLAAAVAGCDIFLPKEGYLDQPCASGVCENGLACLADKCVEAGGLSQPCNPRYGCDSGLICQSSTSTCIAAGGQGQPCLTNNTCSTTDLLCRSGSCIHAGALNEPCRLDSTCATSLTCSSGICIQGELGAPGMACLSDNTCALSYTCVQSTLTCSDLTVWVKIAHADTWLTNIRVSQYRDYVVTAAMDYKSALLRVSDGTIIATSATAGTDYVEDAAVSNDGAYFVNVSHDNTLRPYYASSGAAMTPVTLYGWGRAADFSPDGYYLAVGIAGTSSSSVNIYSVGSWGSVTSFNAVPGSEPTALRYGPYGGNRLAVGAFDGTVKLYNTSSGGYSDLGLSYANATNGTPVRALSFTSDGSKLLIVGHTTDADLYWTESGSAIHYYTVPTGGELNGGAISPDGTYVAAGGDDSIVRLWRVSDGTLVATYKAGSAVYGVDFTSDSRSILVGQYAAVIRWNVP